MKPPESSIWKAKLAAWLHDPAEKAPILLRTDHEPFWQMWTVRGR